MARREKKSPAVSRPLLEKTVRDIRSTDDARDLPSWRFSRMDNNRHWTWETLRSGQWRELLDKLKSFERMNLAQLRNAGCHPIPIQDMGRNAQQRALELQLEATYDEFFSLRLTGRRRVICLNSWPVLELLWYDPNHEAYPVDIANNAN